MRIGFSIRFSERVGDERARRRALLGDGGCEMVPWTAGLPVAAGERQPQNLDAPWGRGLDSALFGGEDTICFTGGFGLNAGSRGLEVFPAVKIAAEVRGHTLRGCMGYSRLERAGEMIALLRGCMGWSRLERAGKAGCIPLGRVSEPHPCPRLRPCPYLCPVR